MLPRLLLGLCGAICYAADIDPALDRETRRLLEGVDRAVRDDLNRQKNEARQDLRPLEIPLPANRPPIARSALQRERQALLAKVEEWTRSAAMLVDLTVDYREINSAVTRSEAIARYYGVDVVKFRRLYELGKKLIRQSAFDIPDRPLPERDESLSAYFRAFFREAGLLQDAVANARQRNQTYRLGLFKKVSFAYIRALLAAGEPLPVCAPRVLNTEIRLNNRVIRTLGCPDPVLEEFRRYIDAIRTIQSAEADTYLAECEKVLAEQQLAVDILAVVPVVGDWLDLYQLYLGENLAGQCLSPVEKGMTVLFTLVPMVGPTLFEQAVKRSDRAAQAALKMDAYFEALAKWGDESLKGFAERHQWLAESVSGMIEYLNSIRFELNAPGGAAGSALPEAVERKLATDRSTYKTLKEAEEGTLAARTASPEVRQKAVEQSRRWMSQNLDAAQNGRAAAVRASNMVGEHLDEIEKVARERNEVIIFRHVNPDATEKLRQHYGAKGMNLKGKSADWGPQRGFIPVDQELSKLGNPAHPRRPEVAEFQGKVNQCLAAAPPCAHAVALPHPSGAVMVVPDIATGKPTPVLFKDGAYFHPETGAPLSLTPGQVQQRKPLLVLAAPGPNGELIPLTADYDLLVFGRKGDVLSPANDPVRGFVTRADRESLDAINQAAERAGYRGGDISQHGAEAWFPHSPGALAQDPLVTVVDPDRGLLTIRRCDENCMRRWCDTTGACRGIPLCAPSNPSPPCIPVDPDRLLKDYFHAKRLDGYSLSPNSEWDWGPFNVLGGWTMNKYLAYPGLMDFVKATMTLRAATRRAMISGAETVGSWFACENAPGGRQ